MSIPTATSHFLKDSGGTRACLIQAGSGSSECFRRPKFQKACKSERDTSPTRENMAYGLLAAGAVRGDLCTTSLLDPALTGCWPLALGAATCAPLPCLTQRLLVAGRQRIFFRTLWNCKKLWRAEFGFSSVIHWRAERVLSRGMWFALPQNSETPL